MKKAMIYTKKLESAGLTRDQAQAHLEILEEIFDMDVATKHDINSVRMEIQAVRTEVQNTREEIRHTENRIMAELRLFKNEIIVKLGMIMCAALGGIATFFKFLN